MCISTTTLTSSPSGLTAAGQKQEACSSTGSLTRPSPSDRPRTTPSSLTLSLATRPPNWSEADTPLIPLSEITAIIAPRGRVKTPKSGGNSREWHGTGIICAGRRSAFADPSARATPPPPDRAAAPPIRTTLPRLAGGTRPEGAGRRRRGGKIARHVRPGVAGQKAYPVDSGEHYL